MKQIIHRRTTCRACGSHDLDLVFALKPTPIGDDYVTQERVGQTQPSYPIDLFMCGQCGLAQITDIIDPEILYNNYIYVTQSSVGLNSHFHAYAQSVVQRCKLAPGSRVMDLGSNDGTLLRSFQALGMDVLGVEFAAHIAQQATASGIPTIGKFFERDLAKEILASQGPARVITANNVFANIDDLGSWVDGINTLLAEDGVFIFESYYLADLIENMVFDFLYHEHLSSFSVRPIQALFERVGLELTAIERVATKGGSLRYFVQRPNGPIQKDGSVQQLLDEEQSKGIYRKETYVAYAAKIDSLKQQTLSFLRQAKAENKTVAGFGASITGTTLIYHFELGQYLDYLVDDNQAKQGRYSPGWHLPVLPSSAIYERKPDYVLVLAWRFADPFIQKHQAYLDQGGHFIVPVPTFRIV
ncbi:class I SAM-dependent methyltransferase [Herbaspirillum rubrisubalbicans]|uniref:Class I SAM-dependent methyltransferase n=2 Tax=Herbaspirillum TaxID=963 RepID=A0AAD0UAP5_9BURK|nr:class I SAM-dependent methyltransferase [Herbaspirillum rubrisubalbicans]ALU91467.1 S-adenosyl-L-methionine (SAM)-dependent methyltransferase [Herbaspirillum rubrisubalbicans M1]AYR26488.1 class I SAM-dependent methyltransferase [Herbaspirillum rubrisubalbicans]